MKARSIVLAFAALSLLAACNKKEETPVAVSFTVSGAKNNAISATAAEKTVTLTVKSNVSWISSSEEEWVKIDPYFVDNDENKEITTSVKLTIAKNANAEARTTKLTFAAKGDDSKTVYITVNQAAAEPNNISVWDMDKYEAVANPSVTTDYTAQSIVLVIHSNVDWTVSAPEWATVSPASNKFDGDNENVTVTVDLAVNDTDAAREGSVRFESEEAEALVIPFTQNASAKFTITNIPTEHPYCDVDIKVEPEEGIAWFSTAFSQEVVEYLKEEGYTPESYCLEYINSYLADYSAEVIANAFLTEGSDVINFTELDPDTQYQFIAFGVKYDSDAKAFVSSTLPAIKAFSTTTAPEADAAYVALAGQFTITGQGVNAKGAFTSQTLLIEPVYINETYKLTFTDGNFTPVDGKYIDSFELDYDAANKQIVLPNVNIGSEGFTWSFGEGKESCAVAIIALIGENEKDEEGNVVKEAEMPEALTYSWSEDYNTLTLTTDLAGETLHWYDGIMKVTDGKLSWVGQTAIFDFTGSTDITRVVASSATSVKETKKILGCRNMDFPAAKKGGLVLTK